MFSACSSAICGAVTPRLGAIIADDAVLGLVDERAKVTADVERLSMSALKDVDQLVIARERRMRACELRGFLQQQTAARPERGAQRDSASPGFGRCVSRNRE